MKAHSTDNRSPLFLRLITASLAFAATGAGARPLEKFNHFERPDSGEGQYFTHLSDRLGATPAQLKLQPATASGVSQAERAADTAAYQALSADDHVRSLASRGDAALRKAEQSLFPQTDAPLRGLRFRR